MRRIVQVNRVISSDCKWREFTGIKADTYGVLLSHPILAWVARAAWFFVREVSGPVWLLSCWMCRP